MDNNEIEIETVFMLKVDGLKRELSSRNLPTNGTKSELQERLLQFVTTSKNINHENEILGESTEEEIEESINLDTPSILEGDELNEKVVFNLETEVATEVAKKQENASENPNKLLKKDHINVSDEKISPVNKETVVTEKKGTVRTLTGSSEKERIENRSKRFGKPISEEEKKRARMEKFGSAVASNNSSGKIIQNKKDLPDDDKIKSRVARFGAVTAPSTNNKIKTDKLKLRQERFVDDRIKKRQERFGVV